MKNNKPIKVLFVCMGNICRSPTAHGVFEKMVNEAGLSDQIHVDSAGTHAFHVGNPPDLRPQETAMDQGVDLSHLRARQAKPIDFEEFDYVLAMDASNVQDLKQICPVGYEDRLRLFLDFSADYDARDVPDPYYGEVGFTRVFDLVSSASVGLLADIRQRLS